MRNKKSVLMTLNHNYGYFSTSAGIAGNGYGYDQWRITSIKLSKYDTE